MSEPRISTVAAAPFLKWAGGKRQLLSRILPLMPAHVGAYFEPFLGGGAVFFALANEVRFSRAFLSDVNPELIATYRAVRDHVGELADRLRGLEASVTEIDYHHIRAARNSNDAPGDVEAAARMIYLNKAGFNGLYRVNKSGGFNVPWGKRDTLTLFNPDALARSSRALQSVQVDCADFRSLHLLAGPGDLVYLDPPYRPASATANFTAYVPGGFGAVDQASVAALVRSLSDRGVHVVASNADTPEVRALYAGLAIVSVSARRSVNRDATKRGPTGEVLILSSSLAAEQQKGTTKEWRP